MSAADRRKRKFDRREALLLDAAETVVQREGVGGLTMDRLGSMIEYSRSTVYLHFANRSDVLAALAVRALGEFRGACERIAIEPMASRTRLLSILVAYQVVAVRYPHLARLTPSIYDRQLIEQASEERQRALEQARQSAAMLAAGVVREAIASGDLVSDPPPNPVGLMLPIWTMMMGGGVILADDKSIWQTELASPQEILYQGLAKYLDGLGWKPIGHAPLFGDVLSSVERLLGEPDQNS